MGTPEIHVGDVGTRYRVRCLDNGVDFDPTSSSVRKLLFKMPGVTSTLERTASIETGEDAEDGQFFLYYDVTTADVVTDEEFHTEPGEVEVQAYLEWADGKKFHSDVQCTDTDGAILEVYANL